MIFIAGGSGGLGRIFIDNGQIGSHYSTKYKDTIYADFSFSKKHTFDQMDKIDKDIFCVLSTISYTDVDGSEKDNCKSELITKNANIWLSDWCNKKGIPFIFISSNDVFSGERGLYNENDETCALNYYCKHKIETENYIKSNCNEFLIIRCNLFAKHSSFKHESFITSIFRKLESGEKINLFYDSFNSPVYVGKIYDYIMNNRHLWRSNSIRHLFSERVSKVDIGRICADIIKKDIEIVEVSLNDFNLPAKRPKDVSLLSIYENGFVGTMKENIECFLKE